MHQNKKNGLCTLRQNNGSEKIENKVFTPEVYEVNLSNYLCITGKTYKECGETFQKVTLLNWLHEVSNRPTMRLSMAARFLGKSISEQ